MKREGSSKLLWLALAFAAVALVVFGALLLRNRENVRLVAARALQSLAEEAARDRAKSELLERVRREICGTFYPSGSVENFFARLKWDEKTQGFPIQQFGTDLWVKKAEAASQAVSRVSFELGDHFERLPAAMAQAWSARKAGAIRPHPLLFDTLDSRAGANCMDRYIKGEQSCVEGEAKAHELFEEYLVTKQVSLSELSACADLSEMDMNERFRKAVADILPTRLKEWSEDQFVRKTMAYLYCTRGSQASCVRGALAELKKLPHHRQAFFCERMGNGIGVRTPVTYVVGAEDWFVAACHRAGFPNPDPM